MRQLAFFTATVIIGLVVAAPTSKIDDDDDKLTITEELFPDSLSVYTAKHDIVNILVPLNGLNFNEDSKDNDSYESSNTAILFFVEAEKNEKGEVLDKGLYILKNGVATKLLDNGRDSAANNDDTKRVYFAASDGIYVYNSEKNTAEKYGSLTDNLIGIAMENGTDVLYILTDKHEVFKVTDDGNNKVKVNEIQNAEQIVVDYMNNIYFYGTEKVPYVLTATGVKKIEGLPEKPNYVKLLRPPFVIDNGVPFVSDNQAFIIYANGTIENTDFELQIWPTAYSMETALIQYYAHNKKIYEYNILALLLTGLLEEVKKFLQDMGDSIQSIATKSRSNLTQLTI